MQIRQQYAGGIRGPTVSFIYEYEEVSPLEAVGAMVETGAASRAEKLFPDEYVQYKVVQKDREQRTRDEER